MSRNKSATRVRLIDSHQTGGVFSSHSAPVDEETGLTEGAVGSDIMKRKQTIEPGEVFGASSSKCPSQANTCHRNAVARLRYCAFALLAYLSQGVACPVSNKVIPVMAGGHALTAEVAANRASHMCGLAFRNELPADHGMLFAYATDQIIGFWMKDTFVDLSIAFLDRDGRILEIHDMEMRDPTRQYISKSPARYALEVNQGWFSANGIEVGDKVEFDLQDAHQIFEFATH